MLRTVPPRGMCHVLAATVGNSCEEAWVLVLERAFLQIIRRRRIDSTYRGHKHP